MIDFPLKSWPLRIKNFWGIHCLLKFRAFQSRKPSKSELEIVLEAFNHKFQATLDIEYETRYIWWLPLQDSLNSDCHWLPFPL